MDHSERPVLFYLFRLGKDIKILSMTDTKAAELWDQGRCWLDVGMKTKEEAEKKRLFYLSES